MQAFVDIAKALADPNRVRILCVLRHNELCVCQVVELLGLANSTVSKHLSILRAVQLVQSRNDGRWVHYSRPVSGASDLVQSALSWCDSSLAESASRADDEIRLQKILQTPIQELC